MIKKKDSKPSSSVIALNRKALHDYFIEEKWEAGLVLQGWEVKSLREGRAQLKDSYIFLKQGEAWLIGLHISPSQHTSTHMQADPIRLRKLLLHQNELNKLRKAKEKSGYSIVPSDLHWKRARAKLSIALVKGKKEYDKRQAIKERDWEREKGRLRKLSA